MPAPLSAPWHWWAGSTKADFEATKIARSDAWPGWAALARSATTFTGLVEFADFVADFAIVEVG